MTADTIISTYLPQKDPEKMCSEPTFSVLHDFNKLPKDNATNVITKLTNSNYGLLPLIISPTGWETLYGHEWIPSKDPGAPPILSAGNLALNMKKIIHNYQN